MRKFRCPFCDFEHTFSPKGKSKYKKRIVGFTCPRCGKKATEKDLRKAKGKGPKPSGKRRNRKKRVDKQPAHIVPIINPISQISETNNIEWRQKGQDHKPPSETVHPSATRHWQPHPTDRTLGDAALLMSDVVPAGMVNVKIESEPVKEMDRETKVEEIERATEAMEEARKKLQGVVINLSTIEKKLNTKIDASTEKLDRSISIISTLLSHLEKLTEEDVRKRKFSR